MSKQFLSRAVALGLAAALLFLPIANGQLVNDPELLAQLKQLFPDAASFSAKDGNPPHFKALGAPASGQEPTLLGYAFWTTELEPLERGFDGPIKMLVGMDTAGVLKGIIVTEHHEPYGYFSVDTPEFAAQFKGKNIRDKFKVGDDVDAISRATISVTSSSRAIRNSSRRVARAYLTPPKTEAQPATPSQ
ncbi:MAG TPA: FMN-binding protein [Gammaproteobacteria bacterium]|nr:FMN-binding protein [Gammaproteobacteria bacterium]